MRRSKGSARGVTRSGPPSTEARPPILLWSLDAEAIGAVSPESSPSPPRSSLRPLSPPSRPSRSVPAPACGWPPTWATCTIYAPSSVDERRLSLASKAPMVKARMTMHPAGVMGRGTGLGRPKHLRGPRPNPWCSTSCPSSPHLERSFKLRTRSTSRRLVSFPSGLRGPPVARGGSSRPTPRALALFCSSSH